MKKHTSKQVQRILATSLAALFLTLNLASCGQQANKSQLKTPAKTSQKTTVKTTAKTTEKTTATSQKATETKKTEAKKTEKKTEARKTEAKKTQAQQAAQEKQNSWTPAEEEKPVRVQAPARTEAPAPARTQAPKPVQTEAPAPPPTEAPAPPPTEAPKPAIPEGYKVVDGYLIQDDPYDVGKYFWFDDYGGEAAAEAACNAWMDAQPYEWGDGYRTVGYATTVDWYTKKPVGWGVYMIP